MSNTTTPTTEPVAAAPASTRRQDALLGFAAGVVTCLLTLAAVEWYNAYQIAQLANTVDQASPMVTETADDGPSRAERLSRLNQLATSSDLQLTDAEKQEMLERQAEAREGDTLDVSTKETLLQSL